MKNVKLMSPPKTNIHHYLANNKNKRKTELMLLEIARQKKAKQQEKERPDEDINKKKTIIVEDWNEKNENNYKQHKKFIRKAFTEFASTGPWDKVMMGEFNKVFKNKESMLVPTRQGDHIQEEQMRDLNYD